MDSTRFTDIEQATHLLDEARSALDQIRHGAFWKLSEDEQFELGRQLEHLARLTYATQIHHTGEIHTQHLATRHGATSTAALLRQAFNISAPDARSRVRAALQILPQESLTGTELPPTLPILADTVNTGTVGPEHIRTIVDTMAALPPQLTPELRTLGEQALVDNAKICDPTQFRDTARIIAETLDPDGSIDDRPASTKTELNIGHRSISTGLTPISGKLDDLGIETLRAAIDPLAAPRPAVDGIKDLRPSANRRAHALVEALSNHLSTSDRPTHHGEVPHISVVLHYDALHNLISNGKFDSGHHASEHTIRQLLCDAKVLPVVLGGDGRLPSIGRLQRTFPAWIRKAIIIRDQGCAWPGCDRPPSWCRGHHITWWHKDFGETSYDNGVLLCQFHHTEIHRGHWQIRLHADGTPEFIPPTFIDPTQTPRRNTFHKKPLVE